MTALDPIATRFAEALAGSGRVIIRLDHLWIALQAAAPELLTSPAKRERLAAIVHTLADAGICTLPTSTSSWDRAGRPPLPTFIRLARPVAQPRRDPLRHPWLPDIAAWAPSARLTQPQLADLATLNTWLARGGPNGSVLPLRERSYEIFGDEKRLDLLIGGTLFRPGRLTLDQIGAVVVHPPFVAEQISDATTLLIIENHNTYWSALRAAHQHVAAGAPCRFGWIAYGAGRQLEGSVGSAHTLNPSPTAIEYFGDLDADGLAIPLNVSRIAVTDGLPPVAPHTGLYSLLLDLGRPAPTRSRISMPKAAAEWLGTDLAQCAADVLAGTTRLAQEAVNRLVLERDPRWLA